MHAFSRVGGNSGREADVFLDDHGTPRENFIATAAIITVIAGYYATAERKSESLESPSTDTLGNRFLKYFKLWSVIVSRAGAVKADETSARLFLAMQKRVQNVIRMFFYRAGLFGLRHEFYKSSTYSSARSWSKETINRNIY